MPKTARATRPLPAGRHLRTRTCRDGEACEQSDRRERQRREQDGARSLPVTSTCCERERDCCADVAGSEECRAQRCLDCPGPVVGGSIRERDEPDSGANGQADADHENVRVKGRTCVTPVSRLAIAPSCASRWVSQKRLCGGLAGVVRAPPIRGPPGVV